MSNIIKGMFIRITCPYSLNDTGQDQEFVLTLYKPKWLDEFYFPNPLASFIDILFKEMWKKLPSAKDYNEIFNIILDGIENILVPLYDKCQYEYSANLLGEAQAKKILSYRKILMEVSDNLEDVVRCRFLANDRLEIEQGSSSSQCISLKCDGMGLHGGPDGIYEPPIQLRGESWNGENFKKEFCLLPSESSEMQFWQFESAYRLNDPNSYESRFLRDCELYLF
jgi:hypothetical protein